MFFFSKEEFSGTVSEGGGNELSKKIIKHFKNVKLLKKKIKFAQKKLFRFDKNNHGKIYSKMFRKI